jgi:hypothetical protein
VVRLARIWEDKITRDHAELRAHLEHVLAAVTMPDHAEPDPHARRRRYYRRRVGPRRRLLVVVSFEQQPGRIITAVATHKDPKRWKRKRHNRLAHGRSADHPEPQVRHALRGLDHLGALQVHPAPEAVEQPLAIGQQHRDEVDDELVE